jgi:acyl-CoA hydrolase
VPMHAPKPPRESEVVMTQMILPSDTNTLHSAFGGRVMEWMDIAGAISAQRHCRLPVVTASMDELHFHASVQMGWNVTLKARVLAAFRTSLEVGVMVTAENPFSGDKHLTTSALMTFVALSGNGKAAEVPPLLLETAEERRTFEEAKARRAERLARKDKRNDWLRVFEQKG